MDYYGIISVAKTASITSFSELDPGLLLLPECHNPQAPEAGIAASLMNGYMFRNVGHWTLSGMRQPATVALETFFPLFVSP